MPVPFFVKIRLLVFIENGPEISVLPSSSGGLATLRLTLRYTASTLATSSDGENGFVT